MATTKKAAKKQTRKEDNVYWVVQERMGMFAWQAHSLHSTYVAAVNARKELESDSIFGRKGYKVDRVELVK